MARGFGVQKSPKMNDNIIEGIISINNQGWCFVPTNKTMSVLPIHQESLDKFNIKSLFDAQGDWKAEIIDEFSHPHLYRDTMLWCGVKKVILIDKTK
jgi:hypothetical protein